MTPFQQIYQIVSQIPKGKVMTYGQIAKLTDTNPRVVGFAMHANKNPRTIPCHRVVKSDGTMASGYAFGGNEVKLEKLRKEGVNFLDNGAIDLTKHLYTTL